MNPTAVKKKEYLVMEIKDKGYDVDEYVEFLVGMKEVIGNDGVIDVAGATLSLEEFSLSELQASVVQFQFKFKKKGKEGERINRKGRCKLAEEIFGGVEGKERGDKEESGIGDKEKKPDDKIVDDKKPEDKKVDDKKLEEKIVDDKKNDEKIVDDKKPEEIIVDDKKIEEKIGDDMKVDDKKIDDKKPEEKQELNEVKDKKIDDIKQEDKKSDDPKSEDKNKDNNKIEDTNNNIIIDDNKPADKKIEELKPEDKKIDEIIIEEKKLDNKVEDIKPKENKPEDIKPEDKKPEDKKPEDNKQEDIKPEDKKPEDIKEEDKKPEDIKQEDKKPEDIKQEDKKAKDIKQEDKKAKDPKSNDKPSKDAKPSSKPQPKPKEEEPKRKEKAFSIGQDPILIPSLLEIQEQKQRKKLQQQQHPHQQEAEPTNALINYNPSQETNTNPNNTLVTYAPSQTQSIATHQHQQRDSTKQELTHSLTTVTKREQVQIYQVKTQTTSVIDYKPDDTQHSTGTVKQEKAFKPSIDSEAQKKRNDELYSAFQQTNEEIQCGKQDKNIFTDMSDIDIKITNAEAVKPSFFSATYYQYTVSCIQTDTEVTRTLDDFEWLRARFILLFPGTFIPPFPPNVYRVSNTSPKKVLYMQRFINALARVKLIRSTSVFADFITLSQVDFSTMKKEYSKLERPKNLNEYKTMEGLVHIHISKEQDARAMQIPKDITTRSALYDKVFYSIDALMAQFDEVAKRYSELSKVFHEIQATYVNCSPGEDVIGKGFGQLAIMMGAWEQGYNAQKAFFRDDVKYYFKFMQKELTTFNGLVEELKTARNNYNVLNSKVNRKEVLTDKEGKEVASLQRFYGFYLHATLKEYERLNKKHAKRFVKQFAYMSDNRDKYLSDYNHFVSLLNFEINAE